MEGIDKLVSDTEGGLRKMVALAEGDLMELRDYLLAGDLGKAGEMLAAVGQKITTLKFLEEQVAVLGAGDALRAKEIQVGFVVKDAGEVLEVETTEEPCQAGRHTHDITKILFQGHEEPMEFHAESRLIVLPSRQRAEDAG